MKTSIFHPGNGCNGQFGFVFLGTVGEATLTQPTTTQQTTTRGGGVDNPVNPLGYQKPTAVRPDKDFSYQLFGMPPDCIAAPVPTKFACENGLADSIGSCLPPYCFAPTGPIP